MKYFKWLGVALLLLALAEGVAATVVSTGVVFGNTANTVNLSFSRSITFTDMTVDSYFRFNDFVGDDSVTQTYTLKLTPSTNGVNAVVNTLSKQTIDIDQTPTFPQTIQYNVTGYQANSIITVYRDLVIENSTTTNSGSFFSYTNKPIYSTTKIRFILTTSGSCLLPEGCSTTTTTTSTTTTSTTTTSTTVNYANFTFVGNMSGMTPCMAQLVKADVKEALKCLYVGENFQRSDGAPTMGYWFYGIIVIGMVFIFYLKVKNITFTSIVLLVFMSLLSGLWPPEGAAAFWGIVAFGILGVLYGIFSKE